MFEPELNNLKTKGALRTLNPKTVFGKNAADSLECAWDRVRISILDMAEKVICSLVNKEVLEALLQANIQLLKEVNGKPSLMKKEGSYNITLASFTVLEPQEALKNIRATYLDAFSRASGLPISKLASNIINKKWDLPLTNWTLELASTLGSILGDSDARVLVEISKKHEHYLKVKEEKNLQEFKNEMAKRKAQKEQTPVDNFRTIVVRGAADPKQGTLFTFSEADIELSDLDEPLDKSIPSSKTTEPSLNQCAENKEELLPMSLDQSDSREFDISSEQFEHIRNAAISQMVGIICASPIQAKKERKKRVAKQSKGIDSYA